MEKKKGRRSKKTNGSGKIIRFSIKELEKMKILKKDESGRFGLSKKAQNEIDTRSGKLVKFINLNK